MQSFKFILVSLMAFGPPMGANATHQIEGHWLNARNHIGIDIEETSQGIRVKRTDQVKWYQYDRIRDDQYRDDRGNTYYQIGNDGLEWESYDGQRRLRFKRSGQAQRYSHQSGDRYRHHNPAGHYAYEQLSGRWINAATGKRIRIKYKRSSIRVKSYRGKLRDFRQTRGGNFIDRQGNRYRMQHGALEYISYRGDLVMRFKRF